ncbi:TIGR04540 family protein [Tissierella sp.]|jgi:uncharacterized protein (TIGR04540 family)|uniref:TIGR04540 family protein n=1 Tax=Tissierella sp. TaxID=41274 RepID=UPI00306C418F
MITFYKSQKDVAHALKLLIDEYWELKVEEDIFIEKLNQIIDNNEDKVFKNKDFTSLIKQRLGKKRMELILKVMEGDNR